MESTVEAKVERNAGFFWYCSNSIVDVALCRKEDYASIQVWNIFSIVDSN